MTTYICQWAGISGETEIDTFSVEENPDHYRGKWKCCYRVNHKGYLCDYWDVLPRRSHSQSPPYLYYEEVRRRDLTCKAVEMTCELLSIERVDTEPRLPSLTALALNIECSRAMLTNRAPRKFLGFKTE